METHTHTRFSETPPGSPKSCMKGSRRLNFEDEGNNTSSAGGSSTATGTTSTHHHHHHHHSSSSTKKTVVVTHHSETPPQSPTTKRSGKTVMIKSPASDRGATTTSTGVGTSSASTQCATEIPFQFHLSQHYDNPPPPPNCTSNAAYEEERLKKLSQQNAPTSDASESKSSSDTVTFSKPESLQNNHSEKLQQYDPQLVAIASKFVNEIIQKATQEVADKHQKVTAGTKRGSTTSSSVGEQLRRDFFGIGRTPWYRRAHGAISKWVTNICVRAQNAMKT